MSEPIAKLSEPDYKALYEEEKRQRELLETRALIAEAEAKRLLDLLKLIQPNIDSLAARVEQLKDAEVEIKDIVRGG
jgi:hypothetical protein